MQTQPVSVTASIRDLRKVYQSPAGTAIALDQVNLQFNAGEITAILGHSGSGKSSLFNCLSGLDKPSAGEIELQNIRLDALPSRRLAKLRRSLIGILTPEGDLISNLNVRENLLLPMSLAGTKPEPQWLDAVINAAGLRQDLTSSPANLSVGQQQRLAAARAILPKPAILLADEPTKRLASSATDTVLTLLRWGVAQTGMALVLFTHDPLVASQSNRVVFLFDGRVVTELASPTELAVLTQFAELRSHPAALLGI